MVEMRAATRFRDPTLTGAVSNLGMRLHLQRLQGDHLSDRRANWPVAVCLTVHVPHHVTVHVPCAVCLALSMSCLRWWPGGHAPWPEMRLGLRCALA